MPPGRSIHSPDSPSPDSTTKIIPVLIDEMRAKPMAVAIESRVVRVLTQKLTIERCAALRNESNGHVADLPVKM